MEVFLDGVSVHEFTKSPYKTDISLAGVSSPASLQVVAHDQAGNSAEASRDVNVTIGLRLTAPNGGETWAEQSNQTITWESSGNVASTVHLHYSTDGGSTWDEITTSTANNGTYTWTLPNFIETQSACKIKVSTGQYADESDDTFTISAEPNTLTLTSPNGGETWAEQTTHDITWNRSGDVGNYVSLHYSLDAGATWTQIISSTPNDGSHPWTLPSVTEDQAACRVKVASTTTSFADTSDGTLTIFQFIIQNEWAQISDYPGGERLCQITFSIGEIGYIGLGRGGLGGIPHDFYKYEPGSDQWTQLSDYPGSAGSWAVAFAIGGYGYVGTGGGAGGTYTNEFYRYDTSDDTWTSIQALPATGRKFAFAFAINGKGYVGGGTDLNSNELDDFWEYDPATELWTQKTNFAGGKRANAIAFVIDGLGYVCGGWDDDGYPYHKDMWAYNPPTNSWTQKAEFPGGGLNYHEGFSIGSKGYIYVDFSQVFWEYDPSTDGWVRKADFPGLSRYDAFGFTIGHKAYIGCGWNEQNKKVLKDIWVYY